MTSSTVSTEAPRLRGRLLRRFPMLALLLAVAAVVLLALGPLGWRAGWWHYRIGFQTLMPAALGGGIAAAVVAVLALIAALSGLQALTGRRAILAVLALLIGGTAAYFPWDWCNMRGVYPRINDITTDIDSPPSFAFAEAMRRVEGGNPVAYGGAATAVEQKKAYPDIAPAMLQLPAPQAFDLALAAAKEKGWTILKADPAAGVIEASERSRWFGFTDDIAIRVTATPKGSRVDIRSGSRQGRGDLGVNATRVRLYLAAVRAAARSRQSPG
jgi:Protein of unknown function (DUF1499)